VVSSSGTRFLMEVREVFDDGDSIELRDRAAVQVRGVGKGELNLRRGSLVRVKGVWEPLADQETGGNSTRTGRPG